jgi:hypothetical protein
MIFDYIFRKIVIKSLFNAYLLIIVSSHYSMNIVFFCPNAVEKNKVLKNNL